MSPAKCILPPPWTPCEREHGKTVSLPGLEGRTGACFHPKTPYKILAPEVCIIQRRILKFQLPFLNGIWYLPRPQQLRNINQSHPSSLPSPQTTTKTNKAQISRRTFFVQTKAPAGTLGLVGYHMFPSRRSRVNGFGNFITHSFNY